MTVGRRHRVFLSYSRSDFYFAEQLTVALRQRGLDVWLDVHELATGSDWSAAIDRAIAGCDFFVLVASRASLESDYVRRELDLAAELGKQRVSVLSSRVNAPALPTYDLRSSFGRGADQLARDLRADRPTGRRARFRLPIPGAALLVALAPALGVLFAAVLSVEFLRIAVGDHPGHRPDADIAYLAAASSIATVGAVAAYMLWSFLGRRITWLYLRGGLFMLPLIAVVATGTADSAASYLTSDPILIALGAPEESPIGPAPAVLAFLVVVTSVGAAVATSFAGGAFRYFRTGIAPRRVRSRHIGAVPRPVDEQRVAHSYRLIAADDDARVGVEVRRSLVAGGIDEQAAGGDRDVVVLSDRTPSHWMSRNDLRNPVAVVATSFSLPVRGVLERFQWVDYRARRGETLQALARDLTHAARVGDDLPPAIPEGLQQPRVPTGVAIAEWTLFSVALFAALISTYTAARWAFTDRRADLWPSVACVAVAPAFVLLACYVRRRRITPLWLVGASALGWALMIALGFDSALRTMSNSSESGRFSWGTVLYVALFAVVLALTWRSLRRWLPDRLRRRRPATPTLGYARGSRAFLAFVVPALLTSAGTALFDSREQAGSPAAVAADICHDSHSIDAVAVRYANAAVPTTGATRQTIVAALDRRIRLIDEVDRELDRLELRTSWGADIRTRLIAAFERVGRAERAYRRTGRAGAEWFRARGALGRTGKELEAAC